MKSIKIFPIICVIIFFCSKSILSQEFISYDFNLVYFNGYYYSIINNDTTKIDTSLIKIRFIDNILTRQISEFESRYNLLLDNVSCDDYYTYLMPEDSSYLYLAQKIKDDDFVAYFQMNFEMKLFSAPNDEYFEEQWYLENINALKAWELESGDPEIKIAVIGSGVYWNHEDLGPGTDDYENIYHNPGEDEWTLWDDPSTGDQMDGNILLGLDDPNEKVDDLKGYEFIIPGNYSNNDSRPNAGALYESHETLIAGIIAAKRDNVKGIAGIAGGNNHSGVSIIPVKLGDDFGTYWVQALNNALEYTICGLDPIPDIIQLSMGNYYFYDEEIDNLMSNYYYHAIWPNTSGGIIVASSGNISPNGENWVTWPAIQPWVISVTATDPDDYKAPFAVGYHPTSTVPMQIEIAAPGVGILSTSTVSNGISNYDYDSGTSFSAPMVSAAAGLIWSLNPNLNNIEVREILQMSADKVHPEIYDYDWDPEYPGLSEELSFGRLNLYEALKMAIDCQPVTSLIIEQDVTWSETQYLVGDITITNESILTITSNVFMQDDAKIIVENGSTLILDGGMISNALWCGNTGTWYGIEIWGDINSPNQSDQGKVIIRNGGEISNSQVGIYAYRPGVNPYYSNYKGGIIQASDAVFRNNGTSVSLVDYPYISYSYFDNCRFTFDDEYLNEDAFQEFVYLRNMNHISFINCSFSNESSANFTGNGIKSFDTWFTIDGECTDPNPPVSGCTQWKYSEFNNLMYGIYVAMSSPSKSFGIKRTNFIRNQKGVYIGGAGSAQVLFCNFEIPPPAGAVYGIYTDRSTGFQIEENNFYNSDETENGYIGMYIHGSGDNPNIIYHNFFNNLDYAFVSLNQNRGPENGLQIKCNEFVTCGHDITVLKNISGDYLGIAPYQGANLSKPDAPAGNRFSWTGPMEDATDIYNEANDIVYYYHLDESFPLKPEYFTLGKVHPEPVIDADWDPDESCPPSFQGGGSGGDTEEMKSLIVSAGTKADSVQCIINLLRDGGSTENLKGEVDLSTAQQTWDIYNELMDLSPYISDTVMESAIEKEEVFPNVMIRDVMVANPHNAKDESLLEKIGERSDPMPEYMIAQILQGQSLVSVYEHLQSNLAFYEQQRKLAFDALATYYLTDTLDPAGSIDSLALLLDREHSLHAKYQKAFLCLRKGDWLTGQNLLNSIPGQFNLTPEQLEVHQQYVTYYNLLAELEQEGKSITEADSSAIEILFEIASLQPGIPSVYARTMLLALDEINYEEPVLLPDFLKSSAIQQEYREMMGSLNDHHLLRVFPNPAGEYLIVEHNLEIELKIVYIEIHNTNGEIVKQEMLNGKLNQQMVDIKQLKPGVYFVSLNTGNKKLESVKFTKIN